jgi:hypothetical protein
METLISNREAYFTLFKLLPLEEQKAVYDMISELLEEVEDGFLVEERKHEEVTRFEDFVEELEREGLYEKV